MINNKLNPLKIAITGSTGLIGDNLKRFLKKKHIVFSVVRHKSCVEMNEIYWNPDNGEIDDKSLEGMDVVVNLSGSRLNRRICTNKDREEFLNSRVNSTKLLSKTLARLSKPPSVFLSASSIDWYSSECKYKVTEENGCNGNDFMAQMCKAWEDSAKVAEDSGIRVVNLRFPYVLSSVKSSIMASFIPIINSGVGGILGSGKQLMCYITLYDIVHAMSHIMLQESISGPVNMVTPMPTTNEEFMCILAELLNKPLRLRYPQWLLKILCGNSAKKLIKGNCYVFPEKLINSKFQFRYTDIKSAMSYTLGILTDNNKC
ncbi:TIGR01777 family oxidoreductase [Clostridium felsineum]|uniref:TIGR01777 family oxidoreductase n=1 Tax=Clostridium felsineum TaxID=36839 RepID=UPI00214DA64E|nr:TIGR01777 family oxidoreductase [Clostridium felsineum]MCR3758490.1 TIGR01777 family oxidoreductase [Clostridium felsineum]